MSTHQDLFMRFPGLTREQIDAQMTVKLQDELHDFQFRVLPSDVPHLQAVASNPRPTVYLAGHISADNYRQVSTTYLDDHGWEVLDPFVRADFREDREAWWSAQYRGANHRAAPNRRPNTRRECHVSHKGRRARAGAGVMNYMKDPCTCTDPMCARHRGLVRDGKGAWVKAPMIKPKRYAFGFVAVTYMPSADIGDCLIYHGRVWMSPTRPFDWAIDTPFLPEEVTT